MTTTMDAGDGLSVTLTEYFTGDKSEKSGINLLLGVYGMDGEKRTLIASRDYNAQSGGYVSRGSLQLADLDRDGTKEILVEYHHNEQPGTMRVDTDILRLRQGRLALVWTGATRVDTSNASLGLSPSEREHFTREIGYLRTGAAEGKKVYFRKTVQMAAVVAFDPPRVVEEEFDLLEAPEAGAPAGAPGRKKD